MFRLGLRGSLQRFPTGPRAQWRGVKTPTIDWHPIKSSVTNLAKAENQAKLPVFRKVILGLMIAMPIISFFLGCWQVRRLQWKMDLIAKCEHMLAAEPLDDLPAQLDPAAVADFEYRRFKVKGHFDYLRELFLGPRLKNGEVGYLLITPFVRSSGGEPILIDRGWIKKDRVIPATREKGYLLHLAMPQGEIEIEAMFRVMPAKSFIQYDHEPGSRLFHIPDVASMAKETGCLPVYAQMIYSLKDRDWEGPQTVEEEKKSWWKLGKAKRTEATHLPKDENDVTLEWQEFELINQGVPVGTIPKVTFTNNHMQYLVTWFGVSLASTALLVWGFLKKRNLRSAEKVIEAKRKDMKRTFR